jgi:hypothetical protein
VALPDVSGEASESLYANALDILEWSMKEREGLDEFGSGHPRCIHDSSAYCRDREEQ